MTKMGSPSLQKRRPPGGLNLLVIAVPGPHRAFAIKISKLNTKSPLRCREGGVVKSPGYVRPDRTAASYFSPRNSGKHFFVCRSAGSCTGLSKAQRRTSLATGGGGVKISTTFRATTPHAQIFFPRGRFEFPLRNQTKSKALASPWICVRSFASRSELGTTERGNR